MTFDLGSILAGIGVVANQLQNSSVGGQKDQAHIAKVSAILSLINFVLHYHPEAQSLMAPLNKEEVGPTPPLSVK